MFARSHCLSFLRLPTTRTGLVSCGNRHFSPLSRFRAYSEEEDEQILRLREEGQSFVKIGEDLPIPRSGTGVQRRYFKLKSDLKRSKVVFAPQEDKAIVMLRSQGMSFDQIALRLERSYSGVRRRWKDYLEPKETQQHSKQAIVKGSRALTLADAKRLHALRKQNITWTRIVESHFPGWSQGPLENLLSTLKLPREKAFYWSEEEDARLAGLREQGLSFHDISEGGHFPGRTPLKIKNRWGYLARRELRKGN